MRVFPRRRLWLSSTGIMVCAILFFGILSVVHWLSFSSSSYFGEEQGIYVLASNGSSTVKQSKVPLALAPALSRMPGIEVVSPELFIYGVLKDKAVIIRGIFPSDFRRLERFEVVEGRWLDDRDIIAAAAGYSLAKKLDLHVNETYVLSGSEVDDFLTIRIACIFRGGGMIDDDLLLNMKYARFLQVETKEGYASIIRVRANTSIWPSVDSIWEAVSGPPDVTPLQYTPLRPNNTEVITLTCNATARNEIASVVLSYLKAESKVPVDKTMEHVGGQMYRTQIGPIRDTPWLVVTAKAIDVLGHATLTDPVNISITDALGPEIYDVDLQPPPPQTKEDELNLTFKVSDTSELVTNLTVHTSNNAVNRSISLPDSPGGAFTVTLGRFNPGRLILWITARDRFDNPSKTPYYEYRILNRTDQFPPEISGIFYEPRPAYDNSTINLTVRIRDDSNISAADLLIDYQLRGRHFNATVRLNRSAESRYIWNAVTGPFPGKTTVHFRVYAKDEYGNAAYSETKDVLIRYSEPPEIVDDYIFPYDPPPGVNTVLFLNMYDAAEIQNVTVRFFNGHVTRNTTIPVNITTFKETFLLGRLTPGDKAYSVEMVDRRGEVTFDPPEGRWTFRVQSSPPVVKEVSYRDRIGIGEQAEVRFLVNSQIPLSKVYLTDSLGVVRRCEWMGPEWLGLLGPYSKPGSYTFTITAQDLAGNTYVSRALPMFVRQDVVSDFRFDPAAPLLGEDVTVSCRVLGDTPEASVDLIAPVGGTYLRIPMALEGERRVAVLTVDSRGVLPFSVEARIGPATYRSRTHRIAVGSGISLKVGRTPLYPTSKDNLTIHIDARDASRLHTVVLEWTNSSTETIFRKTWYPAGPNFSVAFTPPGQRSGKFRYRVTAYGSSGKVTYPTESDQWIQVSISQNVFSPPQIEDYQLSPLAFFDQSGRRSDEYLVEARVSLQDEVGILNAEIEYTAGSTTRTEPLFPFQYWPAGPTYRCYLGPFPVNQTLSARITATNLAGLKRSTPWVNYTLVDDTPPDISRVYHDPLDPSPDQDVTIGCEATDDSGVKDVVLIINGTQGEYRERMERYGNSYTLQIPPIPAGKSVSYRIVATDNYGNQNQTGLYTVRSRDENPPVIVSVLQVPAEPTDTQTVNITVTLYDDEDMVRNVTLLWYQYEWRSITLDGGTGLLVRTFHLNASELEPGIDVRYKVEAYDRSGNKAVYPRIEQPHAAPRTLSTGLSRLSIGQAVEPYLTFRVVDRTPPRLLVKYYPQRPNQLQTVSFSFEASDNHLLRNLTLHLMVDGVYTPYFKVVGRSEFEDEVSSGPLTPGGTVTCFLDAYDYSGNYARYPPTGNISIPVSRLEWKGQYAEVDPRVSLEVAAPAGFSKDMARQGAGKIVSSINGILFMTFLATIAGIGNIVYSSIYRSRREIGILRTLGASKKLVILIVATLTTGMGLASGTAGCAAAYLIMTALSKMGATLAWVTLRPTFNPLVFSATIGASVFISLFGGLVALSRLFSYTPVESIHAVVPSPPKEELPSYVGTTRRFSTKVLAAMLILLFSAALLVRIYPTVMTGEPFDPDSWLHLKIARDIATAGHLFINHASRELEAVSALPGLNILLVFSQTLWGSTLLPARFLTPILSSAGLLFAFVLARRISKSSIVACFATITLAFAGFYTNRVSALTKEAVALQLFLFCLFLAYVSLNSDRTKYRVALLVSFGVLTLLHHLTSIYFVLAFAGYVALTNLAGYSLGVLDISRARRDVATLALLLLIFFSVMSTLGRYETKISTQDALLILSLFFLCISLLKLVLDSNFIMRHRGSVTLGLLVVTLILPLLFYKAGLFSYAPWQEVLDTLGPHLVILGLAVAALYPISILALEQKTFLVAWISTVLPFVLFGVIKRNVFGYILLFRDISYGYQLAAVMAGILLVYAYKRLEKERPNFRPALVAALAAMLFACNLGFASYMGFLSKDYQRKDLYYPKEVLAAVLVNSTTLRGQLVGADERARRLLLYVTDEDGDQLTTYVYLVRMEKYLINRLRQQFEMTDRPLTHVFLYSDMFRVGFVDSVLFKEIKRPKLNRFEDVVFDNGDDSLIYVARKEWP